MEQNRDAPYVDVTQQSPAAPENGDEAHARTGRAGSDTPPPQYSLNEQIALGFRSLAVGDPSETISVPMIHSTRKKTMKQRLLREPGKVLQTVIVRKMPRSHYLAHYAKDENGNYVGTEKPAVDSGLVFVPNKSSPDDLKEQVKKVAFGKMHTHDEVGGMAGYGMGGAGGAGGGF